MPNVIEPQVWFMEGAFEMNAKSRVISLLVAFVLTFGMFGGAAADDIQPVSVTLSDSTQLCYVDIYVFDGTFGSWEYDPYSMTYFNTAATSTTEFWVYVFAPTWKGCDITMSFGGLSNGVDLIGTGNFSAMQTWPPYTGTVVDPAGWSNTGVLAGPVGFGWYDFDMTLNTVPAVPPGTYTGNINATISNTL
jgi:hypothetical protein